MDSDSGPSPYFSSEELSYLSKLADAMPHRVQVSTVKMWLEKAQADGLDPQRIYEAAVKCRPPHWDLAPPFEVLNPIWG